MGIHGYYLQCTENERVAYIKYSFIMQQAAGHILKITESLRWVQVLRIIKDNFSTLFLECFVLQRVNDRVDATVSKRRYDGEVIEPAVEVDGIAEVKR